ncbi:hypothetical protein BJV82DRAFT_598053 [Fennellomyces sp. T-0311]|nr:hypothetical protein BJV82DRAFT_598053 [Fennellomyces sp. T-0311]
MSMSSANNEALLIFQRTQHLQRQQVRNDDHNTDAASPPEDYSFNRLQRLDTLLHAAVANHNYDSALQYSESMKKLEKYSYYGYQRKAQIHLIQSNFAKAYWEYIIGGLPQHSEPGSTETLQKSIHDNIHLFDQEASELAKAGRLGDALEVAKLMMKLLPLFPIGYLRAGSVYEMQGKSKKAMETYEEPLSSDRYDKSLLIQRMDDLQQRIDRMQRYDFILQLPMEVASSILRHLDITSLVNSMNVSEGWKKRILQCPEAWHVITVDTPDKDMNISTFQEIKPFVEKIVIRNGTSNPIFLQDLLTSIGDGEFKNLVGFGSVPDKAETQYVLHIKRILDRIKLEDLDLTTDNCELYIPLHQVLESCRHLKHLKYHTFLFALPLNYNRLKQVEPTTITHLSIGGHSSEFDFLVEEPDFFGSLIRLFPLLVYLRITEYMAGGLQRIMDECTNIRQITVANYPVESFPAFADSDCTPKGLQHLEIDGIFDPVVVANDIAKASKTLKTLNVSLRYKDKYDATQIDKYWDWEDIPSIDFPFLEKLDFYADYFWPFERWIGDCPVLKYDDMNLECQSVTESIGSGYRLIVNYDSRVDGPKPYVTRKDSNYEAVIEDQW